VANDQARRLEALIATAGGGDSPLRRGGSMALPSEGRRLPLSLIVAPLPRPAMAVVDRGATVLVCATDLEAGVNLPEDRLRDLFGLTSGEARVALALLEGAAPREAAGALGVSFFTVRTHLARIFHKTDTNRQAELVRLMMRAVGVPPAQEPFR
jgi:DNA-binding CsgD family transcriptional regulator